MGNARFFEDVQRNCGAIKESLSRGFAARFEFQCAAIAREPNYETIVISTPQVEFFVSPAISVDPLEGETATV